MTRTILVLGHNHFDPTWRRCFRADAIYEGVTVRSYAELESRILDAWLELEGQGYTCTEGQAAILREWLRRDPSRRPRLQAAVARGTFAPVQAGETVQDSCLPTAEGLVRNFLSAQRLWRDLGWEDHPGLEIGWLEDAFGNSGNYPQVLASVGCRVVARMSYRRLAHPVWVGIDGTRLPVLDHVPLRHHGPCTKHPPCPSCAGAGCTHCQQSGLLLIDMLDGPAIERELTALAREATSLPADACTPAYVVGGEESIPTAAACAAVARAAAASGGSVRWGTYADLWRTHRESLRARAQEPAPISPALTPAMPGCMVTRRLTKARTRAAADRLVAAEATLATRAWRAGEPLPPPAALAEAWERVTFAQFHDAITGTHIDSAYHELMAMLGEAEARADGCVPAVAAASVAPRPWQDHPGTPSTCTIGGFEVAFDRLGIRSVARAGRTLLRAEADHLTRPGVRIGELVLEADAGDAWGKRLEPLGIANQRGLGEAHDAVATAPGALRWRGRYRGGHRKVRALTWQVEVTASEDGERLEFRARVHWDTESKRLRAVVPVACEDPQWVAQIPFGHVTHRFRAEDANYTLWNAHQHEHPMLHWASHQLVDGSTVAILAEGLPCVRWQPGWFDLSLLRSPEAEFCQVEPCHYEFWDNDGQRDRGDHDLAWSIWPSATPLAPEVLTRAGAARCTHPLPPPPFTITGAVQVTAWKLAEDGQDWVLRVYEASGAGTTLGLAFDQERTVVPCDALERPGRTGSIGAPGRGRQWSVRLHPFAIATVRVR